MNHSSQNPLGQTTVYPDKYSPELLFPIDRQLSRLHLGFESLPFGGCDLWTAYELSWLNTKGKPQVALAEFWIPANSKNIIESKSFKLYLNSFNQSVFSSIEQVQELMQLDLSKVAEAEVQVNVERLDSSNLNQIKNPTGICLDDLDVNIKHYHPTPELLKTNDEAANEKVYSHLLKTNCPVTGQPDWATIVIEYSGNKIHYESLLEYIISFRQHQDFHEHCVERVFCDIWNYCNPKTLTVYARYTRRGGLDINPYRSTEKNSVLNSDRLVRQ